MAITDPKEKTNTTIQITKATRDLLGRVGRKGQTYDDVIRELVLIHEKVQKIEKRMGTIERAKAGKKEETTQW